MSAAVQAVKADVVRGLVGEPDGLWQVVRHGGHAPARARRR